MRCPKCGYISFDHLESCKKCKKTISSVSESLNGTIYDSAAPLFLQFAVAEDDGDVALLEPMTEMESIPEISFEDDDPEFDLDAMEEEEDDPIIELQEIGDDEDEELSLDEEWDDDEVVMSLDDLEEVSPREEFTLDIEGEGLEEEPQTPGMDFSDIDISDLAPPGEEIPAVEAISEPEPAPLAEMIEVAEVAEVAEIVEIAEVAEVAEVVEEEIELVAELSELPLEKTPVVEKSSSILEDLKLDDLDLDGTIKPVAGSVSHRKLAPSVKTGTALDEFSVDLGELFSEKKE